MATKVNTGDIGIASGVNFLDIYIGEKKIGEIEEQDWMEVNAFREGTFNFTGDEQTVTELKTENGTVFASTTKDGTYGFEGDGADVGVEASKFLLKMEDLTTTTATGFLADKKAIKYNKIANLANVKVRLRFEQGAYDSIVYPNATVSSRLQGSGSAEDSLSIAIKCSAAHSNDPILGEGGGLYLLVDAKE